MVDRGEENIAQAYTLLPPPLSNIIEPRESGSLIGSETTESLPNFNGKFILRVFVCLLTLV
jgi:hypothetical protein